MDRDDRRHLWYVYGAAGYDHRQYGCSSFTDDLWGFADRRELGGDRLHVSRRHRHPTDAVLFGPHGQQALLYHHPGPLYGGIDALWPGLEPLGTDLLSHSPGYCGSQHVATLDYLAVQRVSTGGAWRRDGCAWLAA